MLDYLIVLIILVNFTVSLLYYIRIKCEVPLFVAFFNILVFYRNIALQRGYGSWVNFDYGIAFVFNNDMAARVTNLMTLGSTVLMYSYIAFFQLTKQRYIEDGNTLFKLFIERNKIYIFVGMLIFSLFELVLSHNISANYGSLAVLGNSSFILLFFLVTSFVRKKAVFLRFVYFVIFLVLAYVSYSPAIRFQFLGWMIPLGYYACRKIKPAAKIGFFTLGFVATLVLFSIAGELRYAAGQQASGKELLNKGFDRIKAAEDINFVDGFVMMYEVYPRYLDFTYGEQHLEIFFRPIPRTLWPGKPLAGWFQNYEAKYGSQQLAIGFSPTIYGVFYSEWGTFGVVIFSIFWGWLLCYFYRSFSGFTSDISALLIGILLSCMIPIFRSGDLPGDFAIVIMSFWPMIIFVQRYKAFVKQQSQHGG